MTSTLCASSELDAIVLRFLKDRQHEKTAKLYLKALNKTTVDISKVDDLLTIYNFYQANLENMKNSGGCDESDSDSSDSDDDKSDDESGNQINDSIHAPPKLSTVISSNESDSDSDDSSSSGSSSSTNSSESSVKPHPKRQKLAGNTSPAAPEKRIDAPDSSDSSDGSNDSTSSDESDDSDDSEESEAEAARRLEMREKEQQLKAAEAARAAAEWMNKASSNAPTSGKKSRKRKLSSDGGEETVRTPGEAFKRVDVEEWGSKVKDGLEDNSYVNQFGEEGYGAKANKVLAAVRGKDFRHEKTKRKRGNYRGGSITLASNSFKYGDDDE